MLELAYPLNESVEIDGVEYQLDISFDNILRLFDLLEDKSLTDEIKTETALLMLINDKLDDYTMQEKADIFVETLKEVLGKGAENNAPVDLDGNPMPSNDDGGEKSYSLKEDADYIYASFYQDYGIDLIEQQGKLHWYKFLALLQGLTDGSKFMRVLEIRTMKLPTGKGSEKQREKIKRLQKQYALKGDD